MADILLVLWGESYRFGSQCTRGRGCGKYFERQELASKSHNDLIECINNKFNMKTKILINSYKLNNEDDAKLLKFYEKHEIVYNLFDNLFRSEDAMLNNTYSNVNSIISTNEYKFILFIRIDLYLKKYFIDNLSFDTNYIKFAHIDSNINITHNHYQICQQIMLFPKKYFNTLTDNFFDNIIAHAIRDKLVDNNVPNKDIKYFVNTLHICSTDLGWNPLYIQVGRNNCVKYQVDNREQSTTEYYYDESSETFIKDIEKTINYWSLHIEKNNLEENIF